MTDTHLSQLIRAAAGEKAADDLLNTLQIERVFLMETAGSVSRGVYAMALHAVLFHSLLYRAPTAAAYVADRRRHRERIVLDHGVLRTIRLATRATGALPGGTDPFLRILKPLGYHVAGTYPSERSRTTGRGFVHREYPESLPQCFVSELHVDRFSKEFQAAAERVFGRSGDPLTGIAHAALQEFSDQGRCEMKLAAPALREIVAAFGRWHDFPSLADYRILAAESAEGAWTAIEGFALNHASDRVADVAMTACAQRSLGRPMIDSIEASATGSVRQTAFRADAARRSFLMDDGSEVELSVPGPSYGFISRDSVPGADGRKRIDLRFDAGNAQGTVKMTAAG